MAQVRNLEQHLHIFGIIFVLLLSMQGKMVSHIQLAAIYKLPAQQGLQGQSAAEPISGPAAESEPQLTVNSVRE
jgi:hypothetical protein